MDFYLRIKRHTKHRVVYNEYQSVSSQKYSFETLKTLLENAQKESMNTIDLSFIELGISLAELGAEALDFSDDAGLEFLISQHDLYKITSSDFDSGSRKKLIEDLSKVFYELGMEYEPLLIASAYRNGENQAEAMWDTKPDIYIYYKDRAKTTAPLLKVLLDIDNGKTYTAEELKPILRLEAIPYVMKIVPGDRKSGIKILGEILDKGIYEPSQHPKGKAVDLPLNQQTAQILYENSKYPKYKSTHYHISYR